MHWNHFSLIILFAVGSSSFSNAQFLFNGSAFEMSIENCYQLTGEQNAAVGSIWHQEKINLNESFEVVLEIFLGCKDASGADGMVFGFQPVSTSIGIQGGDLGFGGIVPSLGIEFDTWTNASNSDPSYDHIAIFKNGSVKHGTINSLAGPIQASTNNINIEDCAYHDLRVSWDAGSHTMEVYFDCQLRLSYTGDIVNDIFGNNPWVYWGFTAATGAANNFHRVCLKYSSFLNKLEDVVMCPGGQVPFHINDGVSYSWTPTEGLDDPFSANPIASPSQTTLYTVEIKDICGNPFYDDVLVEVAGDSVFFDLGADTLLCENEILNLNVNTPSAIYQWSDGSQEPNLIVAAAGNYMVTVTRTDTFCISVDKIKVDYISLPDVDLGADTILCQDQILVLSVYHPNAVTYQWQDGSSSDSLLVNQPGNYNVSLSNICGVVNDDLTVGFENCQEVYIPNSFSPNFDGINDEFMPLDGGDVRNIKRFVIFDRWGNLVFERNNILPNDISNAWDGIGFAIGIYTWFVEVEFRNGASTVLKGDVLLVR